MKKINTLEQKRQVILSLLVLTSMLILLGIVFADEINEFTNGDTAENLTFEGNENITRFIEIPKYAYVKNYTITIQGRSLS